MELDYSRIELGQECALCFCRWLPLRRWACLRRAGLGRRIRVVLVVGNITAGSGRVCGRRMLAAVLRGAGMRGDQRARVDGRALAGADRGVLRAGRRARRGVRVGCALAVEVGHRSRCWTKELMKLQCTKQEARGQIWVLRRARQVQGWREEVGPCSSYAKSVGEGLEAEALVLNAKTRLGWRCVLDGARERSRCS